MGRGVPDRGEGRLPLRWLLTSSFFFFFPLPFTLCFPQTKYTFFRLSHDTGRGRDRWFRGSWIAWGSELENILEKTKSTLLSWTIWKMTTYSEEETKKSRSWCGVLQSQTAKAHGHMGRLKLASLNRTENFVRFQGSLAERSNGFSRKCTILFRTSHLRPVSVEVSEFRFAKRPYCHQHQARPVQIDRYPLGNHKPFSSVPLVYSLTQRTFFFTAEAHPAWALVILVAALRHSEAIATLAFMNAYIYHQPVGKRIGPSSNPNIQQTSTQLLLPFSWKCYQALQSFDTQLVRCHCLDLNPASAHKARRSRKTIHEAQADVTGLTKRPEMNITKENFALTRTWTSLWSQGRQPQHLHSELAEQRRTQRARVDLLAIMTRAADKRAKRWRSDGKPRAQVIPRCCFSRARAKTHAQCSVRPGPGQRWDRLAVEYCRSSCTSTATVAQALRANKLFLCRDRALEHVENSLRIADDGKSAAWKKKKR